MKQIDICLDGVNDSNEHSDFEGFWFLEYDDTYQYLGPVCPEIHK